MKSTAIILCFILTISGPVVGQEQLSLSQAIQSGLARNYDIQIESKNIDIARNNNNWGEAGRWPQLNLNLAQNNSLTDNIKTATPFQIQDRLVANSLVPSVTLDWTLFNGFKVQMSKQRLEQLQRETEGNASIVISNTIQSIILGYYTAVLQKRRLDEFQKQMDLSQDRYSYLVLKKELGGASTADLLLEEGNYLTDSTNYINQQLTYRSSLRSLNLLLAEDDPDKDYNFPDSVTFEPINYRFDDLVAKMNSDNVDLKKQYLTQSIVKYDLQISKVERYPSLNFTSGFSNTRTRLDLSEASFSDQQPDGSLVAIPGPPDPLNSETSLYYGNFTIAFTLFNGGKIKRAIQNAIVREDIENVRTDRLKLSLYKDLSEAYDSYNIRRQLYGINRRKREVADLNLQISQEKFRNGTINSFDFRTVQNRRLIAAVQELQSIYNLLDTNVSLMRLTGGIIEEYK
ncbi:MAG: TolC family protein [Bacteroidetes bacterium]|nr:TolC family protein [Bacteroidota bacterium]